MKTGKMGLKIVSTFATFQTKVAVAAAFLAVAALSAAPTMWLQWCSSMCSDCACATGSRCGQAIKVFANKCSQTVICGALKATVGLWHPLATINIKHKYGGTYR